MKLKRYVKKHLEEMGINYKQAGKMVGISPEYISSICKGKIPSEEVLKKMAKSLGLNLATMLQMRLKEKANIDILAKDESPVFRNLMEVWEEMKDLSVSEQNKVIKELSQKVKALLK